MIGVLLVSHGGFAEGIYDGVQLICGEQEKVETIGLRLGDDIEAFGKNVYDKARNLDDGDGVLILVDFLGGSPANVTAQFLPREKNMEAVLGMNFPMLLDVLCERDGMSLKELAVRAKNTAQEGVIDLRERLLELSGDDDED